MASLTHLHTELGILSLVCIGVCATLAEMSHQVAQNLLQHEINTGTSEAISANVA